MDRSSKLKGESKKDGSWLLGFLFPGWAVEAVLVFIDMMKVPLVVSV